MGIPRYVRASLATSPKGVMKAGKLLILETYTIMRDIRLHRNQK
jgi:hypothetical protein